MLTKQMCHCAGLDAVGYRAEAERVLMLDDTSRPFAKNWLDSFDLIDQFGLLLPLFSRGIVTPGRWSGWQKKGMWILDFNRIAVAEEELHELLLLQSLKVLIQQMAPLWSSVSGMGVLGLRGLRELRTDRLTVIKSMESPVAVNEFIKGVLDQIRIEERWDGVPEIVVM